MLSDDVIDEYLKPLSPEQAQAIRSVRALVLEGAPSLVEAIDQGKWFTGLLTYNTPDGVFVFALGPRSGGSTTFHMMPYYASGALQDRHGAPLRKLLSGKSCIRFKRYSDVPDGVLQDIIGHAPAIEAYIEAFRKQHRKAR